MIFFRFNSGWDVYLLSYHLVTPEISETELTKNGGKKNLAEGKRGFVSPAENYLESFLPKNFNAGQHHSMQLYEHDFGGKPIQNTPLSGGGGETYVTL